MTTNENGDILQTILMLTLFVAGTTLMIGIVSSSALEHAKANDTAKMFEQWSVATPHHPLSYVESKATMDAGVIDETLETYKVSRPSSNVLCFTDENDKSENFAVSLEQSSSIKYSESC